MNVTTDRYRADPVLSSRGRDKARLSLIAMVLGIAVLGVSALGCGDGRPIEPLPDAGVRVDAGGCVAECTGRVCGADGCGGSCGTCPVGSACDATGQCGSCTPACAGRVCGDDGCGGSCGACPAGTACDATGQCGSCTPACAGRVCGDDGCGGSCGTCPAGSSCDATGQCQSGCTPSCSGRDCGSDGCSGTCGTCSGSETCSTSGTCEPATCTNPIDCGSEADFICDPSTLRCASPECESSDDCLSTEICLFQEGAVGACYTECVPSAPACGAGDDCLQLDYTGRVGACLRADTTAEGATCDPSANTRTGCAAGLVCIDWDGFGIGVCRRSCQVWGESACPSGQVCYPGGFCETDTEVDTAPVGDFCEFGAAGRWCGVDGGRITGGCDTDEVCRGLCRIGLSDCPSPRTCIDEAETGDLGLCSL